MSKGISMTLNKEIVIPKGRFTFERGINVISVIAVLGMLLGATVIVSDVLMRWLLGTSVVALNEIMAMVFAVAVSATLPSGAAKDANLRVDLLTGYTSLRTQAWLHFIGMILMTLFFALLSWRIFGMASKYFIQDRSTLILAIPLHQPYFWFLLLRH